MAIICAQCGHRNPDGASFCANPECQAFLAWSPGGDPHGAPPTPQPPAGGTTYGSTYGTPRAQPHPQPQPQYGQPYDQQPTSWQQAVPGEDAAASISLSETSLSVMPGESTTVTVTIHNGGTQVDEFALAVLGPTAPWVEIEPPTVRAFPDTNVEAVVRWSPPRASATAAGRAGFTVRATSVLHPSLQVHQDGILEVQAFREVGATLTPQASSGRGRTTHRVEITNTGNTLEQVALKASDPTGKVRFSAPGGELPIPPGAHRVDVSVRPRWRLIGQPVTQPFQVTATPQPPLPPVRLDGTREVVPLIAGWIPKLIAGVVVLLLAAAGTAFAMQNRRQQPPNAEQTPTAPPQGTADPTAQPSPSNGNPSATPEPSATSGSPTAEIRTPWTRVAANGTMLGGEGVTIAQKLGDGRYLVTFGRTVANCAHLATIGDAQGQDPPTDGMAYVATGADPTTVTVETRSRQGTGIDLPFHLQSRCSTGDFAVSDGTVVVRGNNGQKGGRLGLGVYEIGFNRDVSECAFVATIGDPQTDPPQSGLVYVGTGVDNPARVRVRTMNLDGTPADRPFHVQTRCADPFFAVVEDNGEVDRQRGLVGQPQSTGPGRWELSFDGNIARCAAVASIGAPDATDLPGIAAVYTARTNANSTITVETRDLSANTPAAFPFHIHLVC